MRKFHIIAVLIDWCTSVEVFYDSNIQQFNCFFLHEFYLLRE